MRREKHRGFQRCCCRRRKREREHRATKAENRNYMEPDDGLRITGQTSVKQPAVLMDAWSGRMLKMNNSIVINC